MARPFAGLRGMERSSHGAAIDVGDVTVRRSSPWRRRFAYFVKEVLATNSQLTLGASRKALAGIIRRVRENHMGLSNYDMADLVFDVKSACTREGVMFDSGLFNEHTK